MNSFLFSAVTLCLVAHCASAQYPQQSAPSQAYGYGQQQQQRKMAPTPQTYVQQPQQQQQQQNYGPAIEQQYEQMNINQQYGQQMELGNYGAKNGASNYLSEERAPAPAAYPKQQQQSSYSSRPASNQQAPAAAAAYGSQVNGYSKPAPKYEEPYYPPMPFAWGYDINDGYGGAQYHKENGDEYGKRTGSYGYTDAYGIYRQVDYVADENGFRATIKTNEPGTANESPASVDLHAYEPPSNYYAGNHQQQQSSYSAPKSSSSSSSSSSYNAPTATTQAYGQQRQQHSAGAYSPAQAAPSYQPQQQQQYRPASPMSQAYGAPAVAAKSAAYSRPQQAYHSQQQQSRDDTAQYLSSVIVPVYQKSAVSKPAAAKRVY